MGHGVPGRGVPSGSWSDDPENDFSDQPLGHDGVIRTWANGRWKVMKEPSGNDDFRGFFLAQIWLESEGYVPVGQWCVNGGSIPPTGWREPPTPAPHGLNDQEWHEYWFPRCLSDGERSAWEKEQRWEQQHRLDHMLEQQRYEEGLYK